MTDKKLEVNLLGVYVAILVGGMTIGFVTATSTMSPMKTECADVAKDDGAWPLSYYCMRGVVHALDSTGSSGAVTITGGDDQKLTFPLITAEAVRRVGAAHGQPVEVIVEIKPENGQ